MNNQCNDCARKEIRELIKESIFATTKYVVPDPHIYISDHLSHHIDNNITLKENVFRPSSESFNNLFKEARSLFLEKKLIASPEDEFLLETDIGEMDLYRGINVPLDLPMLNDDDPVHDILYEAQYKGKTVNLNKPKKNTKGKGGKYVVYVKDSKKKGKNKVKRVTFGSRTMTKGIDDPKRIKSFVARHRCKDANDKTSARWWSCRLPRYAKALGLKQTGRKWW
jgi:hypothetical protein